MGRLCLLILSGRLWDLAALPRSAELPSDPENLGVKLRLNWGRGIKLSVLVQAQRLCLQVQDSNLSSAVYKLCDLGKFTLSPGVSVFLSVKGGYNSAYLRGLL